MNIEQVEGTKKKKETKSCCELCDNSRNDQYQSNKVETDATGHFASSVVTAIFQWTLSSLVWWWRIRCAAHPQGDPKTLSMRLEASWRRTEVIRYGKFVLASFFFFLLLPLLLPVLFRASSSYSFDYCVYNTEV